jgi:uncharacterized protein (TIGR02147 family)
MALPSIYQYTDFRTFLDEYQKARLKVEPGFSASYICKQLGIPNSRSYFRDVINGRPLSRTFVERFIALLGFDADEAMFFRVLVSSNQAADATEREFYFDQLIGLNKAPGKVIDPQLFELYREWHHTAIRAILDIYDCGDDYAALARMVYPAITATKARASIRLLEKLGLITRNGQGHYKPTDKVITTGAYINDTLVKRYQIQCLELAKTILMNNIDRPHNNMTNVLSVSEAGFRKIEKKMQQFRAEILTIVQKDEQRADRVYQLNVQLFPSSMQVPQ